MNQIVVTLENGANSSLLRRMIENMKGVLEAKIRYVGKNEPNAEKWLEELRNFKNSIDTSVIDYDDERTQYIMSK